MHRNIQVMGKKKYKERISKKESVESVKYPTLTG